MSESHVGQVVEFELVIFIPHLLHILTQDQPTDTSNFIFCFIAFQDVGACVTFKALIKSQKTFISLLFCCRRILYIIAAVAMSLGRWMQTAERIFGYIYTDKNNLANVAIVALKMWLQFYQRASGNKE